MTATCGLPRIESSSARPTSRRSVTYDTEFGQGWVAFDEAGVIATGLPGSANPYPAGVAPEAAADLAARLEGYWRGGPWPEAPPEMLRAAARTDLDREIFRVVSAIPPGRTMTYGRVAELVGRPRAARAIGAAMAANRFAPVIPCHRVVGSDGSLRGYAGGLEMKRFLLEMEADG